MNNFEKRSHVTLGQIDKLFDWAIWTPISVVLM